MREKNLSIRAMTRAINYSAATLSQWLENNYIGDNAAVEKAVQAYFQLQEERSIAPKKEIPFVMTSIARKIGEIARACHLDGEIGVVYGDPGLGKTVAIKRYAEENKNVILMEVDLGHTAKAFFSGLHVKLGMDGSGNVHHMFEDVVQKLAGSNRMIIVDEAEHLPYKALELLRRIYDKAAVGILLVGVQRLIRNLRGSRGEFAQLYSRVGHAVCLDVLRPQDAQEIVLAAIPDSNGIWKTYFDASGGNTRILSKLLYRTQRVAQINRTQITPQIITETAKTLLI